VDTAAAPPITEFITAPAARRTEAEPVFHELEPGWPLTFRPSLEQIYQERHRRSLLTEWRWRSRYDHINTEWSSTLSSRSADGSTVNVTAQVPPQWTRPSAWLEVDEEFHLHAEARHGDAVCAWHIAIRTYHDDVEAHGSCTYLGEPHPWPFHVP